MFAIILAAAKPWTYWFAPPLFVSGVALVLALAVGYYRKVLVLQFRWRMAQRTDRQLGAVTPLQPRPATDAAGGRRAA